MKWERKVVAIGGGTGLSTLLRGLKHYPLDITAIVTVADDGAVLVVCGRNSTCCRLAIFAMSSSPYRSQRH